MSCFFLIFQMPTSLTLFYVKIDVIAQQATWNITKLLNTSTPNSTWHKNRDTVSYILLKPFVVQISRCNFLTIMPLNLGVVRYEQKLGYKHTESSRFSKRWPSNIDLPHVRFGKLQIEYSPLVCQSKHPSVSLRSVWVAVICLKTDISIECNAVLGSILFKPVRSTRWEGSSACLEMVTTSIIESQFYFLQLFVVSWFTLISANWQMQSPAKAIIR